MVTMVLYPKGIISMKKIFFIKEFRLRLILFNIPEIIHVIPIRIKTEEFSNARFLPGRHTG